MKLHRAGRLDQADAAYRRVRGVQPRNFDAWHLSGTVAFQQGRTQEAIELLTRAKSLGPRSAVCLMRLGQAQIALGRTAEAEANLRRATELEPKMPETWDNLAYCLKTQDRLTEAVQCHQRAVTVKPDFAIGWYNFGLTLSLTGASDKALACHDHATKADPNYVLANFGRAQALQQLNRLREAIAAYGVLLEAKPDHHEARSYRLFAMNYLEDIPREQLFAEHQEFARVVGTFPVPAFPQTPEPARRLRVAILSPDLRNHSCAYFIEPLLRQLDPTQFELYLYHDHFREDAVSQRLKTLAAVWRSFVGQSMAGVEAIIRQDRPDILVDLAGHTGMTNRLPLFARHLAPVQITYLGYPNTTGLPAMGYRFTDAVADPVGEADVFATEKLVRFAPTAWAYEPPADAPSPQAPPSAAGAPVTFGCFNNLGKISDAMLTLWGRILQATPGSRLLLKGQGFGAAPARAAYAARLHACGLPLDRVELMERTITTAEHLALYHRVDISLDTFPYNGTTTTCEALWMGVPVITLLGDRHIARVSASLVTAAGHPEWIATSPEDYVRRAVELAADPVRLRTLRAGLRGDMQRSALLDHAGQGACFSAALRQCWREWCEGRPVSPVPTPEAICV